MLKNLKRLCCYRIHEPIILWSRTNHRSIIIISSQKSLVDGHLNAGDVSGAVTLTQDLFNQYKLLPPYTTHLKIIEFALGSDLLYEAKRQVYFIQQLWKWQPGDHDDKNLRNLMYATQRNPKLSKRSLMGLFAYFGEELKEEDFFWINHFMKRWIMKHKLLP